MKLTVTGRRLTLTDATRQDIERKMQRLDRVLNDAAVSAQVVVSQDGRVAVCELTVHARGDHMLHAVGRHARVTTAVTTAVEKVAQQARRVKGRWKTRRRGADGGRVLRPDAAAPEAAPAPDAEPRIIRSRARLAKPMTLDDAVLALDGERRPFLVFRRPDADGVAILFRRPDGHFGLIEPEG